MSMAALYEVLRYLNVAVCGVLGAVMLARGAAFLRAPVASKWGRLALFAWISSTGYGTLEALSQGAQAGPRVPTVTSVLCLTAVWVAAEIRYDRRDRARIDELRRAASPTGR